MPYVVTMAIKFRAVLSSISIVNNPWGEKLIRLEFSEEREVPGPVMISPKNMPSELAKDIVPILSQVLKTMPGFAGGKIKVNRLTLFLYEEEWDRLIDKPNIGDEVEIIFEGDKISFKKV